MDKRASRHDSSARVVRTSKPSRRRKRPASKARRIAGALFGWDKALYSMLFQYATTQVIKMLDPDGRRATLLIITGRETAGGVCAQIQDTNHTATLIEGVGLYNGDPCVMIYSVVSDGEVRALARKIRQSDPKAFVNVLRTERVVGKFYRGPRD